MRLSDQGLKPIDRSGLHSQVERMAEQGYRVLAVAYRDCTEMPSAISSKEAEHDLIFIRYTMTSNSGEIWTLFLAPFLGMPLPLLPIQILWINLVTDGLPGLALSLERKESHIMKRPPRPPNESIVSGGMPWHILWIGLLIGGLSLATQALALATENPHWQTMVFTVLTFTQLCHVLAIRSERLSLFSRGFGGNPALLASIVVTIILQLGVIYIPVLRELFKLQPLSADELLYCMVVSMLVIPAVELEKSLIRHGVIYTKRRRTANAVERS
jgi:Ca2+-transporting ATPase